MSCHTLHNMRGGDVNLHPIQLLVNYWEIRPSLMGERLDEVLRNGVSHIATFVPWQAVESDISHLLVRFLQAAAERRMTVSLIVTPEVGIHYPNSGLPKDVVSKADAKGDHTAQHFQQGPIAVQLPPNGFQLPSFFSQDFTKRYTSFLSRMDTLLADVGKTQTGLLGGVTVVLSGSFWKYYRSPQAASRSPYGGGPTGDYSSAASVAFRQRVEMFYSQKEFSDPNPGAANRWKTRGMEEVNRKWFYQQSEDVFRARSAQFARKKASGVHVLEIELHTPEADPSLLYSNVLQSLAGGHADFARLSGLIDEAALRASFGHSSATAPVLHWSSLGGFRTLADAEKQFLILKSLLLIAGQGGSLLIDEQEWFSFSPSFRSRTEAMVRSISLGDLTLARRAVYLAPHLWSAPGAVWEELVSKVGPDARLVASLELVLSEREAKLLIVDSQFVITRETVSKLLNWAKNGNVLVLPRSVLYTESARQEIEEAIRATRPIEIGFGVAYTLHHLGTGKLILHDLHEKGETQNSWQTFVSAVLALAGIQSVCRLSDSRLTGIPLRKRGGGLGYFVMNETRRKVSADIVFPAQVAVSDLAISLSAVSQAAYAEEGLAPMPANRFALDVPPCGILPLAIDGVSMEEIAERQTAALTADFTKQSALSATSSELPGFNPNESLETLWN